MVGVRMCSDDAVEMADAEGVEISDDGRALDLLAAVHEQ